MPSLVLAGGNGPDSLIWWSWVGSHHGEILTRLGEHLQLAAIALFFGLVVSAPLALLARRYPRTQSPILGITGGLYTIPSLALFFLLGPLTGFTTRLTAEVALVSYTLLILIRNIVAGLDSVPDEVREAARGMGYSPVRLLLRVELPLALPGIIAGVRIATVSTIGLVTIAAIIGQGGLGQLILTGLSRSFHTPVVVGSVLSIALAVLADLLLLAVQRASTPWVRGGTNG
ncbi:MAG: ABC transporter permease [Actinomycetota bacterium]|nr:ABC transporter permease [Actinomycetota bacterium]